jgi:transposase
MSFIVSQKIKGHIYLYKVESYWDKESKKAKQRRTYIGPKNKVRGSDVKTVLSELSVKHYGNIALLEDIAEKTQLLKTLQKNFCADYREILALAWFQIMESDADYLFPYWHGEQYLDQVKMLYSTDISGLYERIGRNRKAMGRFTGDWLGTMQPIHGIYYDITSFSSYSTGIDYVEWGYNRDRENLPQINMGMVCCQKSGLPFFYKLFPGSIADVSTIHNLLKDLQAYHLKDVLLVMDRGFFSTSNITSIAASQLQITFLQPLPFSLKATKELVKRNVRKLKDVNAAFKYNEEIIYHTVDRITIGNQDFGAHIFFNEKAALDGRHQFLAKLLEIESAMTCRMFSSQTEMQATLQTEVAEKYRCYFSWDKRTGAIKRNKTKINEHTANMGYFVISTNAQQMDRQAVLHYYRDKDKVEKVFDGVKNHTDGNRLRVHSGYNLEGKLFVRYIALILFMYITKVMREKKLFEKYSIREMIKELAKIKMIKHQNMEPFISEISKKQKDIFKNFGMELPKT